MVRATSTNEVVDNEVMYVEYAGKSTDTKPTEYGKIYVVENGIKVLKSVKICTGSVFIEIDTGDAYFYDEDSTTWVKIGE